MMMIKMSSIRELQNVLNSGESEVYPDSTAQKIRIFLSKFWEIIMVKMAL